MKINTVIKHFRLICKHKKYVFQFCIKAGIPFRGLIHDLSKFSPTEFFESVKYYTGTKSPIDTSKEVNGYSKAWQHHKGRNTHHYEYWMDNFDKGGEAIPMPYKDAVEMLCDYLGAAKAYLGNDFSYEKEYEWWIKKSENCAAHKYTKQFIEYCLFYLKEEKNAPEKLVFNKHFLNYYYKRAYHIKSDKLELAIVFPGVYNSTPRIFE